MPEEMDALKDRVVSLEMEIQLMRERTADLGSLRSTVADHSVKFTVSLSVLAALGLSAAVVFVLAIKTSIDFAQKLVEIKEAGEEQVIQIKIEGGEQVAAIRNDMRDNLRELGIESYFVQGHRWLRFHGTARADSFVATQDVRIASFGPGEASENQVEGPTSAKLAD